MRHRAHAVAAVQHEHVVVGQVRHGRAQRAKQAGVAVERLEEAQDEEEPKAAVIALILAKEAAGETEEVRAAGPT